jgi:glycine/D-amino acid oxidase-like deaminating enzyme
VLAERAHDQIVGREPPDRGPELAGARCGTARAAAARVEATRIGVRPMPRDRHPIIGAVPERPGLYVVVSHSGITLGPLWGRVAAGEILGRRPDPRLAPFRATRFA